MTHHNFCLVMSRLQLHVGGQLSDVATFGKRSSFENHGFEPELTFTQQQRQRY